MQQPTAAEAAAGGNTIGNANPAVSALKIPHVASVAPTASPSGAVIDVLPDDVPSNGTDNPLQTQGDGITMLPAGLGAGAAHLRYQPDEQPPTTGGIHADEGAATDGNVAFSPAKARKPSVKLSNLTQSTRHIAAEFDHNKDGEFSGTELQHAMRTLKSTRRRNTQYALLLLASCCLVAILVCLMGLASYWAVKTAQETVVTQGSLVDKSNGEPVRVASTEFKMSEDGTLVQRKTMDTGAPAGGDEEEADEDVEEVAISTTAALTPSKLSSALPDTYFKELRSIEFKHPSGSAMYLNVLAVARLMKAKSALGSVVKLITFVGTIIVDGDVVSFSNDVAPIMEEAGFVVHPEVTSSGRRLLGGASVIGWFNMLADATKAKPTLPNSKTFPDKDYTVTMTKLQRCVYDDEECYELAEYETDQLFDPEDVVDLGNGFGEVYIGGVLTNVSITRHSCPILADTPLYRNGHPIKYGVVTIDDIDYRRVMQKVHVKGMADGSVVSRTETYLDRFPGHTLVELERVDGTTGETQTQSFQLYNDTRFYCRDGDAGVAHGSFKVPNVEDYGIAAPAADRRLLGHVLGRRAPPVAHASAAATKDPKAVLSGHNANPFVHERRTQEADGDDGTTGEAVLPNLDADGNVITYETGPLTITYDGLWCVDTDEASSDGCGSEANELRRYTLTYDNKLLDSMGLGVIRMYDDGERPRRIEQPQSGTTITIDGLTALEGHLEDADFELEPCPEEEQHFVAVPPRMKGASTGSCVEPNELWSDSTMRDGLRRLMGTMHSEMLEHAERRLAEHRQQHGPNATLSARQLATELSLSVDVGVCSFSVDITTEGGKLKVPSFAITVECTGKVYIVQLTGKIELQYDANANKVEVTGAIEAKASADLGDIMGGNIERYLDKMPKIKGPVGADVDFVADVGGTISASLLWDSASRTTIDPTSSACAQHYSAEGNTYKKSCIYYFFGTICETEHAGTVTAATTFNGDHLVFRGQLAVSVNLTMTAFVDGFIAKAEFRVQASAMVLVDTAFTRVNKCWASESGNVVRKGVSDGFATITTATIDLSLTGGVYVTIPNAEALEAIADAFNLFIDGGSQLGNAVVAIGGAITSGDVNQIACASGMCSDEDKITVPDHLIEARKAWYALDVICYRHAGKPSPESASLVTAATVALYAKFDAKLAGTHVGDFWRKDAVEGHSVWEEVTLWKVADKLLTKCPLRVLWDYEYGRGVGKIIEHIFSHFGVKAATASGPLPFRGGSRFVLEHTSTIAATKKIYTLDALCWDLVRSVASAGDAEAQALRQAIDDVYAAIDESVPPLPMTLHTAADLWYYPYVDPYLTTNAAAIVFIYDSTDEAYPAVLNYLVMLQADGRLPAKAQGNVDKEEIRAVLKAGYALDIAVWNAATQPLNDGDAGHADGYTPEDGATVDTAVDNLRNAFATTVVLDLVDDEGEAYEKATKAGGATGASVWRPWLEPNVRTKAVYVALAKFFLYGSGGTVEQWVDPVKELIPELRAVLEAEGGSANRRLQDMAHVGPAPRSDYRGAWTEAGRTAQRLLSGFLQEKKLWSMPSLSWDKTYALYPSGGKSCDNPDGRGLLEDYNIKSNVMRSIDFDGHQHMSMLSTGLKCVENWDQATHTADSSTFGNSVLGYFLEPLPF